MLWRGIRHHWLRRGSVTGTGTQAAVGVHTSSDNWPFVSKSGSIEYHEVGCARPMSLNPVATGKREWDLRKVENKIDAATNLWQ